MNVYVESNFVLELVLEQEQVEACEKILGLAESCAIELCIPAYALLEPHDTLYRRRASWSELGRSLDFQLNQFRRSASLQAEAVAMQGLMLRVSQLSAAREQLVRERLLKSARILPIDQSVLLEADRLRVQLGLAVPDATMLAAILRDPSLKKAPSIFVNRNKTDFDDPTIRTELGQDCDVIWSFDAALARILAAGSGPSPGA